LIFFIFGLEKHREHAILLIISSIFVTLDIIDGKGSANCEVGRNKAGVHSQRLLFSRCNKEKN